MTRGRRTIRLAKWAGVGLRVLVALVWVVSMRWDFGLHAAPGFAAMIESGRFIAFWSNTPSDGVAWVFEPADGHRRLTRWLSWPRPVHDPWPWSLATIPLWLPLTLLALPTALLWWLDRRKPRPGFCACGYDLTGNVSGVCPECGQGIA